MEEPMRTITRSLMLALLCTAVTIEAAAQQKGGKSSSGNPNAGQNPGANQSSNGRGRSATAPAVGAQQGGTKAPWERSGVSRADWLLANRLAAINHMRGIAEQNGNTRMLEQADKLETIARRQFIIHHHGHGPCDHPPESP
jgi:hypothetical protein